MATTADVPHRSVAERLCSWMCSDGFIYPKVLYTNTQMSG